MKTKLLAALLLLSLPSPALEITDLKGRTIDVTIIESRNGTVRFRRSVGEVFEVPLATLTAESQKAIAAQLEAYAAWDDQLALFNEAKSKAPKPASITVTSQIVKKIKDGWLFDTYRYFFHCQNNTAQDWSGTVTIHIITEERKAMDSATFSLDLKPGAGSSGFLETHLPPASQMRGVGVADFVVEAKDSTGAEITIPPGRVSVKFEDLAE